MSYTLDWTVGLFDRAYKIQCLHVAFGGVMAARKSGRTFTEFIQSLSSLCQELLFGGWEGSGESTEIFITRSWQCDGGDETFYKSLVFNFTFKPFEENVPELWGRGS